MNINRENYEAYFLDYHEGQLTPEMEAAVLLFVAQNPDLKTVFDSFENTIIASDPAITFDHKILLKHPADFSEEITASNIDTFLIAETEGLLDRSAQKHLEIFLLQHPAFESVKRVYQASRLDAAGSVAFTEKASLKHELIAIGAIDELSFEEYFAREAEGDLNNNEKALLAEFMQYNPQLKNDRVLYSRTLLHPDLSVVYPDKAALKQAIPINNSRRNWYYALAAAASLALLVGIYRSFAPQNTLPPTAQIIEQPQNLQPATPVKPQLASPVQIADNHINKATKLPAIAAKKATVVPAIQPLVVAAAQTRNTSTIAPLKGLDNRKVFSHDWVEPEFTFIRKGEQYNEELQLYYYYLKLNDQLQYAAQFEDGKDAEKNFAQAVATKIKKIFSPVSATQPAKPAPPVDFWTFAQLGVKAVNLITSSEMQLKVARDDDGKAVAYQFESNLMDVEREVKRGKR